MPLDVAEELRRTVTAAAPRLLRPRGLVAAQGYASASWNELVELWRTFNLHLARVMESTPAPDQRDAGRPSASPA